MKTPAFWSTPNTLSTLLIPASWLYQKLVWLRNRSVNTQRVNVPVLCVGGLTAGGAGKTPVCLHIGELCRANGINAWFVSRGYKGKLIGPVQVKPSEHTAYDVGDEPLLLAGVLPTAVSKNRLLGAQFAAKVGAQLIIMDDGFQNPSVHKDVSLIVTDGTHMFGNNRMIPAGPLREPVMQGLKRADGVIIINPKPDSGIPAIQINVLRAQTRPNEDAKKLAGKKVLAFCGLAYPQKFFATLDSLGAEIVEKNTFPDHYQYTDAEIDALALKAKELEAVLVTTSKDAARMNSRSLSLVTVVYVTLDFEKPDALMELIRKTLASS